MKRYVYKSDNTVQVFRFGTTSNDKIEQDKKRMIVQSYTFSKDQFDHIANGEKGMKAFFNKANTNCLDCPFNGWGKGCYTHKMPQFVGFVSMLKSIQREFKSYENLPDFSTQIHEDILTICQNTYVRFGTYGEPSLHPLALIRDIVQVCDNWTGYTHQWFRKPELGLYFMASTHNPVMELMAQGKGYRSFIATEKPLDQFTNCPASKEGGYKSTCSKCGLCSGTEGKGSKSIFILTH